MRPLLVVLAVSAAAAPAPVRAQLGEVHLGALASYGAPAGYRAGGGALVGVAAGRILYAGARASYHVGRSERSVGTPGGATHATRAHLFGADFGVMVPYGRFEISPGATIGWARVAQTVDSVGVRIADTRRWAFVVAPTLAAFLPVAGLWVVPEFQYFMVRDQGLPRPVSFTGPMGSVRIVIPIEIGRIRY